MISDFGKKSGRTFFCVMSEFYDNGAVKVAIRSRMCKEKPENTYRELPRMDAYTDWFDTREEAERFMAEARVA